MIRVLIADDHEMVREGLRLLLSDAGDIHVVGQAATSGDALQLTRAERPDVLLLDLVLSCGDGIAVARELAQEKNPARVLILTSYVDAERVREAIKAGAVGYLLKEMSKQELIDAIRAAASGIPTLHPLAQVHLMRQVAKPDIRNPLDLLTEREKEVLQLIAQGCSNKEIAVRLSLTLGTVKGYVSAILAKIEVADRTQATLVAIRHGLVPANTPPQT